MSDLTQLTDAELRRQLTDCRITLESIYPYRCKDVSLKQAALRTEWERRYPRHVEITDQVGRVVTL